MDNRKEEFTVQEAVKINQLLKSTSRTFLRDGGIFSTLKGFEKRINILHEDSDKFTSATKEAEKTIKAVEGIEQLSNDVKSMRVNSDNINLLLSELLESNASLKNEILEINAEVSNIKYFIMIALVMSMLNLFMSYFL